AYGVESRRPAPELDRGNIGQFTDVFLAEVRHAERDVLRSRTSSKQGDPTRMQSPLHAVRRPVFAAFLSSFTLAGLLIGITQLPAAAVTVTAVRGGACSFS